MATLERVIERARRDIQRVVLPESGDERVVQAAIEAARSGIARTVLLGTPDALTNRWPDLRQAPSMLDIVDPSDADTRARYADLLVAKRSHRGMTHAKALDALVDPVVFATLMVAAGDADGCVAGAVTPTADVVRYAMRHVGKRPDTTLVSSCFLMLLQPTHPVPDAVVVGDCALVIEPDADQLADIAAATGDTAVQLLGLEPAVAMLSFSTAGSARHAAVSKVQRATDLLRDARPDWRVVGEVQLDAAVVPDILARKAPDQASDTPCNVLIFPNLDAGNIGYKLIERFGGAQAIGPILQGLARPVNDLSRGCSSADIISIIAVTAAQAAASPG